MMAIGRNEKHKRIFAVGDIHGCHEKLERLFERLPYRADSDTLVFLGDYIDRIGKSRQVIDFILDLQQRGEVVTLLGNHEHLLLEYHRLGDDRLLPYLRQMGIENTLSSYGERDLRKLKDLSFLPESHRCFLQELRPYWETEEYIFVHAGVTPGTPLQEHTVAQLVEGRDMFLTRKHDFGKVVVFGHTAFTSPLVTEDRIGIDTGASAGNMLTAVELPALRFYHA